MSRSSSFTTTPPRSTRKGAWWSIAMLSAKGSFEKDHEWNVRWLRAARRVLKPDGTLWASGTHHVVFSVGFALQSLGFRIINDLIWQKPDLPPNALHTAFTHAHETLLWASKVKGARHTFNYDLVNSPNPDAQVFSVWRIPAVPKVEKLHGYHPKGKPLRLVRRALLASTREGDLVFDPFCGSGTTAVAVKELNRAFVGAELEEEFAKLAARRIRATRREACCARSPSSSGTLPEPATTNHHDAGMRGAFSAVRRSPTPGPRRHLPAFAPLLPGRPVSACEATLRPFFCSNPKDASLFAIPRCGAILSAWSS